MATQAVPQTKAKPKATNIQEFVNRLQHFRKTWEGNRRGESLVDTMASVGIIMQDIIEMIDITPEQETQILGKKLQAEIQECLN